MQASSIVLSADKIIAHAKDVLTPLKCEWDACSSLLSSWMLLQKHLHVHPCQKGQVYECRISRCAGRHHKTSHDFRSHIDMSHMSRINLPCPALGCSETFGKHIQILTHFDDAHSNLLRIHIDPSTTLKPTWRPFQPQPNPPRLLPQAPVASWELWSHVTAANTVHPVSSARPLGRKWSRLDVRDDDDEPESIPMDDFPKLSDEVRNQFNRRELHAFVLRCKQPEPWNQLLSRPQRWVEGPHRVQEDEELPLSEGYEGFSLRYDELEVKELIDGSGEWPTE
ncbi:hypothetical protein JAAARDRAFT_31059 [Jaapia argillacea MUCL 33604]|uniref:C2H2-type domain-containing protein n=1 Tax=Jaapia argillacea MUCL 33604 TaxID=933084 RepID=A0A067QDM5_9AGAM|nr:hypothetical protein JAAARDRAFT_31059 [Jaapia argillacea MUCL 33604]